MFWAENPLQQNQSYHSSKFHSCTYQMLLLWALAVKDNLERVHKTLWKLVKSNSIKLSNKSLSFNPKLVTQIFKNRSIFLKHKNWNRNGIYFFRASQSSLELTWAIIGFKLTSFMSMQAGSILLRRVQRRTPSLSVFARSTIVARGQFTLWSFLRTPHFVNHSAQSRQSSPSAMQPPSAMFTT